MLKIYHSGNSVCSQKVRLVLAEKQTDWQSIDVDLSKGEQFSPDYLTLNPEGVVPTLDDGGFVVRESSVIIDYIDQRNPDNLLMPDDAEGQATTRMWLVRAIEIHAAINSMTFATIVRDHILGSKTPEQVEEWLAGNLNPQIEAKRRDLMSKGANSVFVDGALHTLTGMLRNMDAALTDNPWLTGTQFALADAALLAYVDRVERLGMEGLWLNRYANIAPWLKACQARPSYHEAISKFYQPKEVAAYRASGKKAWLDIEPRLSA